jgi:hypothetical protein
MEIFHIGDNSRKLVSVFYAGDERKAKKTGIIICNPIGHEYTRFYRTVSVLAKELGQLGFPVSRFDYYGTGDSYGDEMELSADSSMHDLKLVAREMREGCDIDKLCLIGIRYGSFLSMLSLEAIKPDALVLWNPVFSGHDYIEEIESDEKVFFQGSFAAPKKGSGYEYFGKVYSNSLIQSLKDFDVSFLKSQTLQKILILADPEFVTKYNISGYPFFRNNEPKIIENTVRRFWLKQPGDLDKSLVPINEIKKITEWLGAFK